MKRSLTSSEKVLLATCALLLAAVALLFTLRDYRARHLAATSRIAELEPRLVAAEAAAADAPFWQARAAWLDQTLPAAPDPGLAHSQFLQDLQTSARDRGLTLAAPVLLKPEASKYAQDFSITLQVSGPDGAVLRWLAELQSPEKLRIIKFLLLAPLSAQPPRLNGTVTIAQLFKP